MNENLINVPGVQTPINVAPAQAQILSVLAFFGIAAAVLLMMRAK